MSDFSMTMDTKDYIKIMNTLTQISKLEQEAVIHKGLQEGLELIVKQGKINLRGSGINLNNTYYGKRANKTTHLVKSFKKIIKKKELKGWGGFSRPAGSAAHLIDRGTQVRATRKGYNRGKVRATRKGYNRGKVTGNLFWTKAVDAKSYQAQMELMDSVEKSIENIRRRNNM